MLESAIRDEKLVIPVSTLLEGEYGFYDVCIGVPVIIGSGGVEPIIEPSWTALSRTFSAKALPASRKRSRHFHFKAFYFLVDDDLADGWIYIQFLTNLQMAALSLSEVKKEISIHAIEKIGDIAKLDVGREIEEEECQRSFFLKAKVQRHYQNSLRCC